MGIRIGGGLGPFGGSIGSGGLGLRVGPVSTRLRGPRLGRGGEEALNVFLFIAVVAAVVWKALQVAYAIVTHPVTIALGVVAAGVWLATRPARRRARRVRDAQTVVASERAVCDLYEQLVERRPQTDRAPSDAPVPTKERIRYVLDHVELLEERSLKRGGPRAHVAVRTGRLLVTDRRLRYWDATGRVDWQYASIDGHRDLDSGGFVLSVRTRKADKGLHAADYVDQLLVACALIDVLESPAAANSQIVAEVAAVQAGLAAAERELAAARAATARTGGAPRQRPAISQTATSRPSRPRPPNSLPLTVARSPVAAASPAPSEAPASQPANADLRPAPDDDHGALVQHINAHGPALTRVAGRTLAKAAGLSRQTTMFTDDLHRQVAAAVARGHLAIHGTGDEETLVVPGVPIPVRPADGRTVADIPLLELAAAAATSPATDPETVARHVQRTLGLARLTASATARIGRATGHP